MTALRACGCCVLLGLIAQPTRASAPPAGESPQPAVETTDEAILRLYDEWRFAEADRALSELRRTRPDAAATLLAEGYERFLSGDYPTAVSKLKAVGADQRAKALLVLAEGAAKTIAGHHERRSKHFVIRFPAEDEVLADYALEALESAAQALEQDLGYQPPRLIPVDILRSPSDLALVTSLTVDDVERTGTIAVSKWSRIMLSSPRAMRLGYPWQESLSHELVHCAVSTLTHDHAPVWLQEGFAKFLDHRWKDPAGLALSPSMQHLLAKGLASDKLISFDAMHPSMAKLPRADDAMLAFAEVTTAIGMLHARGGMAALREALQLVDGGADARLAVARAFGGSGSWPEFEKAWKAYMVAQHYKQIPGFEALAPKYRKSSAIASRRAPSEDEAAPGGEAASRFLRLGNMLVMRNHVRAAAVEYEKGSKIAGPVHWLFAVKLGRAYLALGDTDRALQVVAPARTLYPELPWPHLIAGEALLAKGDAAGAVAPLLASLAANPFDPSVHCGLAHAYEKLPPDPQLPPEKRNRATRDCQQMGK